MVSNEIPLISVIMSVFNGDDYLAEAIESILAQTFRDFEFIIMNDGSNDNSDSIIKGYLEKDKRIRYYINEKNFGLAASLNRAIDFSRGKYIARMDSDDYSLPTRLEKQFRFLEKRPDIGILGTYIMANDTIRDYPSDHNQIYYSFLGYSRMVAHPTVMLRRNILEETGCRYDPHFTSAQDFRLWNDLKHHVRFSNIKEVLLNYRIHDKSISSEKTDNQKRNRERIIRDEFLRNYSREPSNVEWLIINRSLRDIKLIDIFQFLKLFNGVKSPLFYMKILNKWAKQRVKVRKETYD